MQSPFSASCRLLFCALLIAVIAGGLQAQQVEEEWQDLFSDTDADFTTPTVAIRDALNGQLDAELGYLASQTERWQNRLNQSQAQLLRLRDNEAELQAHILALDGNIHTYRVLQEQRAALPTVVNVPGLAEAIATIRLRQFEVNQLQREMQDTPATTERVHLVSALQEQLQRTLRVGINLQQTQRELISTSGRLRTSLRDELFWIPSNPVLGLTWWQGLPQRLFAQVSTQLQTISLRPRMPALNSWQLLGSLVLLAAAGFILWGQRDLRAYLQWLNAPVASYQWALDEHERADHYAAAYPDSHDYDDDPDNQSDNPTTPHLVTASTAVPSPWLTPGVMAVIALLSAPPSLALLAIGWALMPVTAAQNSTFGPVLMALAFSLFVLQFLHRVLRHPDICALHFRWQTQTRQQLLKFIRRFAWVLLPTTFILAIAQQQTVALTHDNLGVLALLFAGLAIAYLFRRLLRNLPELRTRGALYWVLNTLLVALPLVLVGLTVAGYYYSSLQLTARLLATFYVLTGWVIAEVVVMRGVDLATEQLRRQRAEQERAHLALNTLEPDGNGTLTPATPLPKLDLAKVTQQSRRLAQFLILLVFGGLMFWVWSDLVGVLAGLNDWAVWGSDIMADDTVAGSAIGLLDVFSALVILVLTFFFAANLPGLLEMMVLSRLNLQQGSAYAITTLLNYIITTTGIVMALSALGVSWDKLQWLVAALSVGLGFGLQEIFANFVSGLIILFERPIRIGDVVTLGNLSGKVSQIRIRATTITEFDRKEIIVPNKTFVTGQLINWSLSDTVTRVTVKLGVAYGSDLDRTKALLLQAAEQNARVLSDPAPQVLFLSFGASSLDHELRIHVKELGDRNPAIDEINRFIDREFAAAGIEIAFQQVDIRLRNSDGLERVIERRTGPEIQGDRGSMPG